MTEPAKPILAEYAGQLETIKQEITKLTWRMNQRGGLETESALAQTAAEILGKVAYSIWAGVSPAQREQWRKPATPRE